MFIMRHAGIDEAGYGPTLGPLALACAIADAESPAALAAGLAATGVKDSKEIHKPKDLAPLEQIALSAIHWLTGFIPDTAVDVFAVLGETAATRQAAPWMANAETLRVPVAATAVAQWSIPGVIPRGLRGSLVHPRAYNATVRSGKNKADLEWAEVGRLLAEAHCVDQPMRTVVDRLGGRKFYREVLQSVFPATLVLIEEETPLISRYRLPAPTHAGHDIGFYVGGESASPLTAVASCVAKYARELHMLLLNRYWCGRLRWLKPTAGYPQDAKRWLHQLGNGFSDAWADELIRIIVPNDP